MFKELKDKIKIISKSKKIKVFYFGNTAGREKSKFQLTSIRENQNFIYFGAILYNNLLTKKISKLIDGKFDLIFVDLEKKVKSISRFGYINIERAVKDTIKKTRILGYKGNDLTIQACETLIHYLFNKDKRGIGGKKILILGAGNVGFKIALKLVECGAELYLFRRNKKILKSIIQVINSIKPKATAAKAQQFVNFNAGLKKFDLIIGATNNKSLIFLNHIKNINKKTIFIDIGKGIFAKNALELAILKKMRVYRLDITPAYDGYFENVYSTLKINDFNLKKTKKVGKYKLVSRGILSSEDSIIVDDINNPKQIFGISNGLGGFKEIGLNEMIKIKKELDLI